MSNTIRQAGETRRVIYDQERFRLYPEDEDGLICYLGNIYEEYCSAPEENREAMMRGFVRTWFSPHKELPTDFEDLQPDLLPVLVTFLL